MKRAIRSWKPWAIAAALLAVAATVVSLVVLASQGEAFTATPYTNVVRFEAQGVASLQVQILGLSGRSLWDSGVVPGSTVDWNRTNTWGERLAYGAYVYNAQGWNSRGALIFHRSGKLAVMPGDKVQLQQAPRVTAPEDDQSSVSEPGDLLQPMAYQYTNLHISNLLGVGTDSPSFDIQLHKDVDAGTRLQVTNLSSGSDALADISISTGVSYAFALQKFGANFSAFTWGGMSLANWARFRSDSRVAGLIFTTGGSAPLLFGTKDSERMRITATGNLGIGLTDPAGKLDIRNSASQPALRLESSGGTNLIEAYNTGSGTATGLVFRVERSSGDVRADGAFYGAGFHTGSADVAEHVNASETLEPGDVVEIDPDNPQHFRLARTPGSRLVAGVISTDPGVVLGSPLTTDHAPPTAHGQPLLALAGRIPVKATTENGPIVPGDMLISSSKPGYAMRCSAPHVMIGMVIGKALEPLDKGEGLITAQVMLR